MFKVLTKKEVAFLAVLVGILVGMLTNVFLGYSVNASKVENIINESCKKHDPDRIIVYFFGKLVTVTCKSGDVNHYTLEILNGNGGN